MKSKIKLTRGQQIAQTMSSMGFRPDWRGDASVVEYVKDYAEPDGRVGRLTAVFSKTGISQVLDSARLLRFVVTVQGVVDPVITEVRERAPKVMQPDMMQALEVLEGISEPSADTTAACDLCGAQLAEWTVSEAGQIHCLRPEICDERLGEDS